MPGFDGTGPHGRGPAMGRGFGPCRSAVYAARWDPAAASPVGAAPATYGPSRGGIPCGCGRGFGRGGRFRRM
jgi:hypothetical protein